MKRSQAINLQQMRKMPLSVPKTLAIASAISLSACSSSQDATIYTSAKQCTQENPNQSKICNTAYAKAQQEAIRTAPKYRTKASCELEFGHKMCQPAGFNNWFMPTMAGFMVAKLADGRYQPVFTSKGYDSPFQNRWLGADGTIYGKQSNHKVVVTKDSFQKQPTATRTVSRGGFGSVALAKSSWGRKTTPWRSGYRGSWGG